MARTGRPALYQSEPNGETKRCTKCGIVYHLDGFYQDKGGVIGRVSACKLCCRAVNRRRSMRIVSAYTGPQEEKTCCVCKVTKPASMFAPNRYAKGGLQSECRPCRNKKQRWWQLQQVYGLTRAEYERMHAAQGGGCAICGGDGSESRRGVLFVDHCHATGKIRGLLCESCNLGIGKLKDSADVLRKAADYLERHK